MIVNKKRIIEEKFFFPKHLIKIKYSLHFLKRVKERKIKYSKIPKEIRITEDIIYNGVYIRKSKVNSFVLIFPYSKNMNLFISLNPWTNVAKTAWIRSKIRKYISKQTI